MLFLVNRRRVEATMEANPGNTTNPDNLKRVQSARWRTYVRRAVLSVTFLTCATAAIQAHDIYSGLLTKEGKRCCNETDCRPAEYRVDQSVRMLVDGMWVPIPEDRIQ